METRPVSAGDRARSVKAVEGGGGAIKARGGRRASMNKEQDGKNKKQVSIKETRKREREGDVRTDKRRSRLEVVGDGEGGCGRTRSSETKIKMSSGQ